MNFSESRQNRSRENREKSKNRFFSPTPTGDTGGCQGRPSEGGAKTWAEFFAKMRQKSKEEGVRTTLVLSEHASTLRGMV